jgi:hypothetical protein
MRRAAVILSLVALPIIAFLFWMAKQQNVPAEAYKNISALSARTDVRSAIIVSNGNKKNISKLDAQWVQEMTQPERGALVNNLMQTPLSQKLSMLKKKSARKIDQIMIMDKTGALVAADRPTHDYDQSDEPKWLTTVGKHNINAVHEFSENRNGDIFDQLSQTVQDKNGQIIGAITIVWRR